MSYIFLWREGGVWVKSLLSGPRPSLASRSGPCPLCWLSYPSKSSPNLRTVNLSPFLIGLNSVFPSSGSRSLDLPSPHFPPLTLLPAVPPKRRNPACPGPHPFPVPDSPDFYALTLPTYNPPRFGPLSFLRLLRALATTGLYLPASVPPSHHPLPTLLIFHAFLRLHAPTSPLTFQSPCPIPPAGSGRVLAETGD